MNNINFINKNKSNIFASQMKNLFIILSIALFACKSASNSSSLDAEKFKTAIETVENIQVIDVRTAEEFQSGHLKNAINIDINSNDFIEKAGQLYKEMPVYVYCLSGKRSLKAANELSALGFKNIVNLDGGIKEWKSKGYEITAPEVAISNNSGTINNKDVSTFKEAIKGDKLVMVDFNATWCGPCQRMAPYVEKMQTTLINDCLVYMIDTDEYPTLAQEYAIQNLPTLMFFKNGKVLDKKIGYTEENQLMDLINQYK